GRGATGKRAKSPRRERTRNDGGRRVKPDDAGEVIAAEAQPDADAGDLDADGEEFSRVPFDQLDVAELENAAREMVARLTAPFLGDVTVSVAVGSDRVRISLTDVDDPGLLIGRDGQTLASLQYLVTRMLSNRMNALLRVQIDAGDYRERQDERLRELALSLAEKVKAGGRPQVTRPLSSYHRRVIHLTLQDDPQVQTHSKGEGEMKRVMVARRKAQA
ncbi:MAG: KH domain-containing protein, partial [Deltaproteobacteria bacterium]|nr:KH domain-containing protein [Deltaproteobacteria bacterium]